MYYFIACRGELGKEIDKLLDAAGGSFGQGAVLVIALVHHIRAEVLTIQKAFIAQLDGQGNGLYLKTLQKRRGKITSTVGSNHNGFGHNNQLLNIPFPDWAVAKKALLSVDGFLCGEV